MTPTISKPARTYHVVTVVWGAEFIDLFLNVCVPNQLSRGNLSALPQGSRYRVITRQADVATLAASPILNDVRRIVPVDIVDIDLTELDPQANANRYKMMTAGHRRAAADAAAADAALIFLAPDFVLAEGTIAGLVRIHSGGARAIMTANLRLLRESFRLAWREHAAAGALAPRQLVRLGMRHLHPETESLMIGTSSANGYPTAVYWPERSAGAVEGLLVRALHLHPLLLDPVLRHELPQATIDGHYVMQCCPDVNECHVVDDSDHLVVFELSPADHLPGRHTRSRGVSRLRLAAVAAKCDPYQLAHWQQSIRLHAGDLDERWTVLEAQSAAFVRDFEGYRRWAGPALSRMYRLDKFWRRRRQATARAARRLGRSGARVVRRTFRRALHRREVYARTVQRALRPRFTAKQFVRPARLFFHRAAKAAKLRLKRVRRHVRLFRPA